MIKKYDELIVMYYVCTLVECWMSPAKYMRQKVSPWEVDTCTSHTCMIPLLSLKAETVSIDHIF